MKYGLQEHGETGIGLRSLLTLEGARWKPFGATIDWDTVDPVESGRNAIYSLNTEVATDGTFTVTVAGQTTAALDHDVTVALLEAALEGLSTVGAGNVQVSGTAADYVIEFIEDMREQPVTLTVNGTSLVATNTHVLTATQTGVVEGEATLLDGTVVAVGDKYIELGTLMTKITATGKFGPANTTASDGREIVTNAVRGNCFILDRPMVKSIHDDVTGNLYDAGIAFFDRLQLGAAYTGAPTEANLEAMLPSVTLHRSDVA